MVRAIVVIRGSLSIKCEIRTKQMSQNFIQIRTLLVSLGKMYVRPCSRLLYFISLLPKRAFIKASCKNLDKIKTLTERNVPHYPIVLRAYSTAPIILGSTCGWSHRDHMKLEEAWGLKIGIKYNSTIFSKLGTSCSSSSLFPSF